MVSTSTGDTRVMDSGQQVDEPFKKNVFKPGANVLFLVRDDTLVGIRIGEGKGDAPPKGKIAQAKIIALDLDRLAITLKVDGKDRDLTIADNIDAGLPGKNAKEKMQAFKPGDNIQFLARKQDGKDYLVCIRLEGGGKKDQGKKPPVFQKVDSSKLVAINELGNKEYKDGHKGGFYPDGKNERPKAHEDAGLRFAKDVQPRDASGKPDANGKIVMLSVGMSNTSQASQGFERVVKGADGLNPQLLFVNGAQGGMTAFRIQTPDTKDGKMYWAEVDRRLGKAGVTRDQVQVIWIKQADAGPSAGWPKYAKTLEEELERIVQLFPKRFPNAKLVYLSSRTYGGYANGALNPEPYAYESAFSVKWLIEKQLQGGGAPHYHLRKGGGKAH